MSVDEFFAALKSLGLTQHSHPLPDAYIFVDRDKQFTSIPDPVTLTDDEREAFIALLHMRIGFR
jgi:hypothetical protein